MPDPGPAYTALFKEKANAPFVHGILYNIAHGIDVPIRANFTSLRQGAPAFVCATKPGQIMWSDVDGIVQDGYTDCMRVGAAGNALLGLRIIILCPDFFSFPAQPPRSRSQCMTVDPQHPDSFLGDGESMAGYQLWILLHELAHAYIYAANGGSSDIYLVNDNLDLQAAEAVKNAQSFTYYVASKLATQVFLIRSSYWARLTVTTDLFLDCTNFPLPGTNSPSTQTHGIELLETKGHLISDATTMSSA
ncbi:hypothetical protein N7G274_008417 [Stereocaulon virgatum]|uniref:Lysine-specific metallo-endopeptidase domain-containing protein n=1 Tax=Stereocaulon virgatum TaxID=373712 RepID=A0ABR4A1F5_9LECA